MHLQEVKEGDMLIYPSWLEHFVPPLVVMIELQLVLTQTIQFIERNKMIEISNMKHLDCFHPVMIFDLSENDPNRTC